MKKVYVFSGLGADERIFYKIHFGDANVNYVKWLQPLPAEAIEDYAKRLCTNISIKKPVLLGLSFGGMMAIEVAKHIEVEKIILLSSAKGREEIPFYYKAAGKIGLHKIIPASFFIRANIISNIFFSSRDKEEKKVLQSMLHDTDPVFLKWAINAIVTWKNKTVPPNLVHIHGNADRILPARYITNSTVVNKGAHLMVMNKADEVSVFLNHVLNN